MADAAPHPTLRKLLHLAWPIVVSRSAQVVIGFTDAAMVARLGESELAATTAGGLNVFAALILPMGVTSMVASFVSQLHGRGDHAGARRFGWYGLALSAMAQVFCCALMLVVPAALGLLAYAPDVRALMEQYMVVRLWSGGAAVGLEALANYYGGIGNTRLPMAAQVLCMVLNVVLDWVFIYGHLGAPAMGVAGSALASSIATGIAFLALFGVFVAGVGQGEATTRSPLRLAELGRVLRFGLPAGLNWFVEVAAFNLFINVVVARFGTTTLAAFMAVMQINHISFMAAFGMSTAGSILVGHALGARAHDRVPPTVWLTMRATCGWQGFMGLLYLTLPALLLRPFVPPGAEQQAFLDVAVRLLVLSTGWQLFDGASMTMAEALRAAGDTTFAMWARVVTAWLVFFPGAYVSVVHFGATEVGAVAWVVLYMALLTLTLYLRFRGGAWRKLDLTGAELPEV